MFLNGRTPLNRRTMSGRTRLAWIPGASDLWSVVRSISATRSMLGQFSSSRSHTMANRALMGAIDARTVDRAPGTHQGPTSWRTPGRRVHQRAWRDKAEIGELRYERRRATSGFRESGSVDFDDEMAGHARTATARLRRPARVALPPRCRSSSRHSCELPVLEAVIKATAWHMSGASIRLTAPGSLLENLIRQLIRPLQHDVSDRAEESRSEAV